MLGTGAAPGPGTVAGGGVGYALGEEVADKFDEWLGIREGRPLPEELKKTVKNALIGATFEAGGQVVIPAVAPIVRAVAKKIPKFPVSLSGAQKKAGDVLKAHTSKGPIVAKNIEDAKALEKAIPGLKFGRGQATNDPAIIKFERARERMPGEAAAGAADKAASNSKVLQEFIDNQKGAAGIDDVVGALERRSGAVAKSTDVAAKRLEREVAGIESNRDVADVGVSIREAAITGKKAAKKKAGELFDKVPEHSIDATILNDKIKNILKPFSRVEDVKLNIPSVLVRTRVLLKKTKGALTPKDLQGIRTELTTDLRRTQGGTDPNARKAARISKMIDAVDDLLTDAGVGAGGGELKTAQQFFKKEVIGKFKSGSVGDILKKSGGQYKVTNAGVASRFFKPGSKGAESAQEFVNAVGANKNARSAIEEAVRQDLVTNATNPITGELTEAKLKTWLARHKHALRGLDLQDRFKDIGMARSQLDKALEAKIAFDKSVASRMLGADVETAVKSAFSKGAKGKEARTLYLKLKGDKKAIAGLQNATIDHIIDNAMLTTPDAFNSPIVSLAKVEREFKKLKPAISVIFEDSPAKLKAFNAYRAALRTLQRNKTSPVGGGSETAAHLFTAMARTSGLSMGRTANIGRALIKPLIDMSDSQVNALLNRAAFDPEFAHTLMFIARKAPADIIARRLKGHMLSIGMKIGDNKEK